VQCVYTGQYGCDGCGVNEQSSTDLMVLNSRAVDKSTDTADGKNKEQCKTDELKNERYDSRHPTHFQPGYTHTQRLIHKHYTHLFRSIAYTDHCLHYLLPEKRNRSMNLRHRGHEYTLSHIRITQLKNSFLTL